MWSFPRVCPSFGMEETKIIYYIDDEDTPYLIKLPIPADRVTLGDFKNALNRPNYKFFFKSVDDDFGWVSQNIYVLDACIYFMFNAPVWPEFNRLWNNIVCGTRSMVFEIKVVVFWSLCCVKSTQMKVQGQAKCNTVHA